MKYLLPTLFVVIAAALLTGCPQSKLPDNPTMVPQPKAALSGAQATPTR